MDRNFNSTTLMSLSLNVVLDAIGEFDDDEFNDDEFDDDELVNGNMVQ